MTTQTLIQANATHIPVPDGWFHAAITSPPYWGLRSYQGIEPTEWPAVTYTPMPGLAAVTVPGCDPSCAHVWGAEIKPSGNRHHTAAPGNDHGFHGGLVTQADVEPVTQGQWCQRCMGWRGCLGLEPTPEMYVAHLVLVFREVWRVLRSDGVCWVNLGDSYNAGTSASRQYGTGNVGRWHHHAGGYDARVNALGLKPKDLCGIPWRVAFALQAEGWFLRSDVIWCLSGGTHLYARTQNGDGPATIKDLARLDPSTVQLWNGEQWVQLLGMNRSARRGTELEIVLRSGERISCTPSHRFPTQRGLVEAGQLQVGDVLQRCKLPEPEETRDSLHLDAWAAWFAGLYVAEGSRSGRAIVIASHAKEEERWQRVKAIAESYGGSATRTVDGNNMTIRVYGKMLHAIIDILTTGKGAYGKAFSPVVWNYSDGFLQMLLDGYLSGDGHYDRKNKRWRIGFARNYNLERDLRTICARLGDVLTLNLSTATSQDGIFPAFRGEIRRKASSHHNAKDRAEVVEIRNARCRYVYDLGVEGEPHLFALASGVLTHNSKPNPMPESVRDRPTKAHEYVFLMSKGERYFWDQEAVREATQSGPSDIRKMLEKKDRIDAKHFHDDPGPLAAANLNTRIGNKRAVGDPSGRNIRTVWDIATAPYSGAHFACYPPALIRPMVRASTSERGCCVRCGRAWVRVVESSTTKRDGVGVPSGDWNIERGIPRHRACMRAGDTASTTLGHRPACDCYGTAPWPKLPRKDRNESDDAYQRRTAPIRRRREQLMRVYDALETVACRVLDPFIGSGTTCLVAREEGQDGVGLDLSYTYLRDQARKRLQLDALDAWENGITVEDDTLDDLPLFSLGD